MSGSDMKKNIRLWLMLIHLWDDFLVETSNTGVSLTESCPMHKLDFRSIRLTFANLFFLSDVSGLGVTGVAVVWGEGIILDRGISQNPRAGEPAQH